MSWLRSLIRPSLLLVVLIALALTACQGAVGEVPPVNQPPTPLAPELVGVWQESLASGGEHRDDVTDCDGDSSRTLANDPLEFAMALVAGHDFNGMRSQTLELTGGPV